MREHLHHRTGHSRLVDHQYRKEHKTAVRHRRVGVDIFEVGLHTGREGSVDNRYTGQDKEYPGEVVGRLGHQIHCHAEAAVASELHQHAGVKHRHCRRRTCVTVGAPCVEGEHRAQHTESDKCHREEEILPALFDVAFMRYLDNVPGVSAVRHLGVVVDADQTEHQEGRAAHEHKGQLHRRVFLAARAPHADEKIHRDKSHLIEHEHREKVHRDEEAVDTRREEYQPKEERSGIVDFPRGERTGKDDNRCQNDHGDRNAVDSNRKIYVESLEPCP